MSGKAVEEIIGRAIVSAEFRELLFKDPGAALQEFDLTAEEMESLKNIERERFDAVAAELEDRISRASFEQFSLISRKRPGYEPGPELLNFFTQYLDGKGGDILTDLLPGR